MEHFAVTQNLRDTEGSFGSFNHGNRRANGEASTGGYLPRLVKLEFPRYNGEEDPTSWICRADQFFNFHQTAEEDRVPLASFNMEGDAQLWYQILKKKRTQVSWDEIKEGLHSRYGPNKFQDFHGEFSKLQQSETVKDYQTQFERLLIRIGTLEEEHQIGGVRQRAEGEPPS